MCERLMDHNRDDIQRGTSTGILVRVSCYVNGLLYVCHYLPLEVLIIAGVNATG